MCTNVIETIEDRTQHKNVCTTRMENWERFGNTETYEKCLPDREREQWERGGRGQGCLLCTHTLVGARQSFSKLSWSRRLSPAVQHHRNTEVAGKHNLEAENWRKRLTSKILCVLEGVFAELNPAGTDTLVTKSSDELPWDRELMSSAKIGHTGRPYRSEPL